MLFLALSNLAVSCRETSGFTYNVFVSSDQESGKTNVVTTSRPSFESLAIPKTPNATPEKSAACLLKLE